MPWGQLSAAWGLVGFSALILAAIGRLAPMTGEAMALSMTPLQWALMGLNVVFMLYSEGYRGFQKSFSPRLSRRLQRLAHHGSRLERWLAPLYCMSYFNDERRQMVVSYSLTALIIVLVLVFRQIPQPWRGVLDAGVVAGLIYGLVVTWVIALRQWPRPAVSPSQRFNP